MALSGDLLNAALKYLSNDNVVKQGETVAFDYMDGNETGLYVFQGGDYGGDIGIKLVGLRAPDTADGPAWLNSSASACRFEGRPIIDNPPGGITGRIFVVYTASLPIGMISGASSVQALPCQSPSQRSTRKPPSPASSSISAREQRPVATMRNRCGRR